MFIDTFYSRFDEYAGRDAIIWEDEVYDYAWLSKQIDRYANDLERHRVEPQTVACLEGDFTPSSVALFLALIERGVILVPLTNQGGKHGPFLDIAQVEAMISIGADDSITVERTGRKATHGIYSELRRRKHPGLVLFSSGSTGAPKAAVHDMVPLLRKFETRRHAYRSISFLLYDHIGGINTMLHTLSNGGCLVTVRGRTPDEVLRTIATHRVELLPTSPTFMNLILLSEAHEHYDLSSLKIVTYGTEPMPPTTLRRFHELFPEITLQQTYGLSELGILRSKSKSSDSLWVRIGGEGFEIRVVDGILQIKAQSAMVGYLNAPSPFTEDGWFNTNDRVEVDGDHFRILGRDSELINVGGEKVYPTEVESAILEMDNVADVVVYKEPSAIVGNIVCARVALEHPEDPRQFSRRLKAFCATKLERFKVPSRVVIVEQPQHNERFKRIRGGDQDPEQG